VLMLESDECGARKRSDWGHSPQHMGEVWIGEQARGNAGKIGKSPKKNLYSPTDRLLGNLTSQEEQLRGAFDLGAGHKTAQGKEMKKKKKKN